MWAGLTELDYLVMDGNLYFNSSLPPDLVALPRLEFLYTGFSDLGGSLDFISEMPMIFEIWLDDNPGPAGTIPTSLAEAPRLVSLSLTNCELSGTIPTELGLMTNMIQLWLYDNDLTGEIPTELGNLSRLAIFEAQQNSLEGAMPSEICVRWPPIGRLERLGVDCDEEVTCD